MIVGLASTRKPKANATRAVFRRLADRFGVQVEEIEFVEMEIDSGVEETPRSLNDLMQGAKMRGKVLLNRCNERLGFAVGMEGGLFSVEDPRFGTQTFLQSWAYVTDSDRESFGASGALLVPDAIAVPVMQRRESLGEVIDRIADQTNVRSNQGTWGILTRDLISRQDSFELALTIALAPFYNPASYVHRDRMR
jgi:inosine/xanthosine triphosphatase